MVEDLDALYAIRRSGREPRDLGDGLEDQRPSSLSPIGRPVVTTPVGIQGLEEAEDRGHPGRADAGGIPGAISSG